MGSYAKDLRQVAEKYGFTVGVSSGGHYVLTHPGIDRKLFAARTPKSAWRTLNNVEADIRRLIKQRGITDG